MKRMLIVLGLVICVCGAAVADVIVWEEDFSNVDDWMIVWEQHGDTAGSISSDGTFGLMYVDRNDSGAAFSPSAFMAFNATTWSAYNLNLDVENITWSMSYQIGFDEFDADYNYLSSVTVHPQGTFVGSTSYELADVEWNAGSVYVRPKITVNTGDGGQTLTMDDLQLTIIPEPGTVGLTALGFAVAALARRIRRLRG